MGLAGVAISLCALAVCLLRAASQLDAEDIGGDRRQLVAARLSVSDAPIKPAAARTRRRRGDKEEEEEELEAAAIELGGGAADELDREVDKAPQQC